MVVRMVVVSRMMVLYKGPPKTGSFYQVCARNQRKRHLAGPTCNPKTTSTRTALRVAVRQICERAHLCSMVGGPSMFGESRNSSGDYAVGCKTTPLWRGGGGVVYVFFASAAKKSTASSKQRAAMIYLLPHHRYQPSPPPPPQQYHHHRHEHGCGGGGGGGGGTGGGPGLSGE